MGSALSVARLSSIFKVPLIAQARKKSQVARSDEQSSGGSLKLTVRAETNRTINVCAAVFRVDTPHGMVRSSSGSSIRLCKTTSHPFFPFFLTFFNEYPANTIGFDQHLRRLRPSSSVNQPPHPQGEECERHWSIYIGCTSL